MCIRDSVEVLDDRAAVLHPVARVEVGQALHLPDLRLVDVPAQHGIDVLLRGTLDDRSFEVADELDRLLDQDRSRWKTVDRDSHAYYRGQACYFKAYNYFLAGQKVEARQWVDQARTLQPEADGPFYLSGVLYFDDESLPAAEKDFLKVIVKGTSLCDAYFRLGKIEQWRESKAALFHFIDNGICLERNLATVRARLEKARQMQLEPAVRAEVEELFEQDLKKRQNEAIASVISMVNLAKSMESIDTIEFQKSMEERLSRINRLYENP